MKILNVEQGTKEWHDARRCKITGTKLDAVMGTPLARRQLIAELIAEKGTEQSKIIRATTEMERGNSEENFAIQSFENKTGKKIDRVGICFHNDYDWLALSPDGFIENDGKYTEAVEIKCPDSKKAILYKIENEIPMEETGLLGSKGLPLAGAPFLGIPIQYKWQVVHYFIVNEDLQKMFFSIYDERFIQEENKLYTVTIDRNEPLLQEAINEAMEELIRFRELWLGWERIVLPDNF